MKIDMLEPFPQESSREYIYRLMKANIINLNLPPGTGISEKEVADLVGVSRAPVREAFIKLSQEALLDILPQRGTYVSLIDINHADESQFVRAILEKEVVKIACAGFSRENLFQLQSFLTLQELSLKEKNPGKFFEFDDAMHYTIFAGCNKARTWLMIEQMGSHYSRVRMLNLSTGFNLPRILEEHRAMVQTIRDGDVEAGAAAAEVHLSKMHLDLRELLKDFGHYFKQPRQAAIGM